MPSACWPGRPLALARRAAGALLTPTASERRLLRAAFSDVPVPLFLLARDGTVVRVNKSAAELLGSKPGYATGRPFTAFVALQSRAAVETKLSAVARSGQEARVRCGLLGSAGAAAPAADHGPGQRQR